MARPQANYVTLDVFSKERFQGNPVAIVKLDIGCELSQDQKQKIAREFNFSETVFLHSSVDENHRVELFTPVNEMQFAGHPIIGTGHLLFRESLASTTEQATALTIMTKAGPVPVTYDRESQIVSASVPHNIHVHQHEATLEQIRAVQASVNGASDLSDIKTTHPAVSTVKGVTYALVDLTKRHDLFSNIVPGGSPQLNLDEGWTPSFTGVMYYRLLNSYRDSEGDAMIWELRVRMIAINLEDPACGSGSCALSAYLALSNGQLSQNHRFNIEQGSEMERSSKIMVAVRLDADRRRVMDMELAGQAAFVAEGKIHVG
ncbi:hypothetical protein LMH87_011370 [Akanthomyces muscarius]|uniref:Phenazine biosynthesis-like protein n=1 Tax=Akanthomyces muscarius TaxID=2231603 RepID=A0A9W8QBE5_AKAMU|nr:hypothetical protein LMH87_011370 [Akanthomyces muscarius]KAJ4150630.1 hypothetical protein LMH87_011370 [Akanthomyces muscarius]